MTIRQITYDDTIEHLSRPDAVAALRAGHRLPRAQGCRHVARAWGRDAFEPWRLDRRSGFRGEVRHHVRRPPAAGLADDSGRDAGVRAKDRMP